MVVVSRHVTIFLVPISVPVVKATSPLEVVVLVSITRSKGKNHEQTLLMQVACKDNKIQVNNNLRLLLI